MKYDEAIKVYRDNLVTEAYARNEGRAEEKLDNARNAKRWGCRLMSYPGL